MKRKYTRVSTVNGKVTCDGKLNFQRKGAMADFYKCDTCQQEMMMFKDPQDFPHNRIPNCEAKVKPEVKFKNFEGVNDIELVEEPPVEEEQVREVA